MHVTVHTVWSVPVGLVSTDLLPDRPVYQESLLQQIKSLGQMLAQMREQMHDKRAVLCCCMVASFRCKTVGNSINAAETQSWCDVALPAAVHHQSFQKRAHMGRRERLEWK